MAHDDANDANPIGTLGFAFIEFAAKQHLEYDNLFTNMGFSFCGLLKEKIALYQQGNIRFIVNAEKTSHADTFYQAHGPSVSGLGFYVKDASTAFKRCIERGAKAYDHPCFLKTFAEPAIKGIGGSILYLIDNQFFQRIDKIISHQFENHSLVEIDHVTHNLFRGEMQNWVNFYQRIFNFHIIREFDIEGQKSGLRSQAMCSPCGKIKIPLNESKDDISQIEEYLREYKGMGIQHVALSSNNIYHTVSSLQKRNVRLLDTPNIYYDLIEKRLPKHGEPLDFLRQYKILIDGSVGKEKKLLLQIFSENVIGPIFFEFIQRKGDDGFGEGNFQALFESIELDQIRRGVLIE